MIFYDENNKIIDTAKMEKHEQELTNKFIKPNDVVLELGARYGTVSCTINKKLNNKKNQVSIEPDERVWNALEQNKIRNNCEFNIVKGFISNKKLNLTNKDEWYGGYGATYILDEETNIPSYTLNYIIDKFNLHFNVLVADCEGCIEMFFDENPLFYDNLRLVMYEADYPKKCNYYKIANTLKSKNFKQIVRGHQNVWIKQQNNFYKNKFNKYKNKIQNGGYI